MMPTLTAIICNYNHGAHVGKAIRAIAEQSRPPDEFIIVDDGSTDNSVDVIEPFASKYPFIKFLRNDANKGLMFSFARALSTATGDFLYSGSADDFVLPGFFEKIMSAADHHPESGAIMAQYRCETPSGKRLDVVGFRDWIEPGFRSPEEYASYLYTHPFEVPSCSTVFNRKQFVKVGGYIKELGPISDMFAMQALVLKFGGYVIPEPLVVNVVRGGGYSHRFYRDPSWSLPIVDQYVALMRSPEFSGRFSARHVAQFEIYAKLMVTPYKPEENALVPMNLHHVREAFLALATWESPISMLAALFMKGALRLQEALGGKKN